ncbi:MAG: DUF485 domain-containing protein [Pseudonocardia sp.]|nr:DUF485 domain-containing protein [Pseudonocardia sp.]
MASRPSRSGGLVERIVSNATLNERPAPTYEDVQRSAAFTDLKRRLRRFVFPMSAGFLLWYLAYVVLASYAPGFMATRVAGSHITVGLLLGLGQFVTTFVITQIYVRYAERTLDPRARDIRRHVEKARR